MKPVIGTNFRKLTKLMPHRVREVLLVSSSYDAFILEEDGYLTERIFAEYRELNLTSSPRVTHASTGEEAIQLLQSRRMDLVITMRRLADMDVVSFGRRIKELYPKKPVVMLALDETELQNLPATLDRSAVDDVFLWSGDANILLAIVKIIEDRQNIDHDLKIAGVRVLIVVEDTVRYYSKFLGVLYNALLAHAQSLISEGLNDAQRIHRMRARPKILLTWSYDEAVELFERYQDNVLAVISDIRYPREGKRDPEAGYLLTQHIRQRSPDLPIVLQSADPLNAARADKLNVHFLDKNSTKLLEDIRSFLVHGLGFGDFVFRLPNGAEVARARDIEEMSRILPWVSAESLRFHAGSNHISTWLMARCEFEIARQVHARRLEDHHDSPDEIRQYLIKIFDNRRRDSRSGVITDFSRDKFNNYSTFTRLGSGSIGGKARGIAFLDAILHRGKLTKRFKGLPIKIPQTVVIGAGIFDDFLEENNLRTFAYHCQDDQEIAHRFIQARLPRSVRDDLRVVLQQFRDPLAVRSSGVLEDSAFEPFAGVYDTYMLPNQHDDLEVRLSQLCVAIRLVYASVFTSNARAYIQNTTHRLEEEKMAVIVQRLIGQQHAERFYPHFAGVAQSLNFYPISHQQPEEGVVLTALGLGRTVVGGGEALRFSPAHPNILPQIATPKAALRNTQRTFWALDMTQKDIDLSPGDDATLQRCSIADAEVDGTLRLVASVYCPEDDRIRDGLTHPGPRLVTFANILKAEVIPLAPAMRDLLEIGRKGMGRDVQIEFAVDMGDWGKPRRRGQKRQEPVLYVLQMRPLGTPQVSGKIFEEDIPREQLLCQTNQCLGSGLLKDIGDILYVKHDTFDPARTREIAAQVGEFNTKLHKEGRPYVLIGPGRWGSSDPWLGVPVQWSQINGAKVIIEASPEGYYVEPSQGSHFFQNITSLRMGYLTVPPAHADSFIDWDWLDSCEATETEFLRHVRLSSSLEVRLDGRRPRGVILKPAPKP